MNRFNCLILVVSLAALGHVAYSQTPISASPTPKSIPQVEVQLKQSAKDWTDHAKVVAELLAPLTTAFFGIWILLITKRLERAQWYNQKLVEKRIEVWDRVGAPINDIFCYCIRVGRWKQFEPPKVIEKKRTADQQIYLSRPYFSPQFFRCYQAFIHSCFETFQGHGEDAKLKTAIDEHKNVRDWNPAWDNLFYKSPGVETEQIRSYNALINQACHDFSPGS